jgi:hypothetical protein
VTHRPSPSCSNAIETLWIGSYDRSAGMLVVVVMAPRYHISYSSVTNEVAP